MDWDKELIKLGYRVEDFGTIQNVFQSVAVKETSNLQSRRTVI